METKVLCSGVHHSNLSDSCIRSSSERPNLSEAISCNDIPVSSLGCTGQQELLPQIKDACRVLQFNQVDQLSNMHPKKSPAASYYQEFADDRHTINIPENVLGLRPMAKESDICIPLDCQKEVELVESGTTTAHSKHLDVSHRPRLMDEQSNTSDIICHGHDQTLEASRPDDGDIILQTSIDEYTKRNDQLAKLFAICLAMATISIAVATAVLFELPPTEMTNLHHPILFKSMAWSGVLSFISSATACGLSYINPHIQFLIRFIEMFLILSFSLILFTLVIALLIL